MIPPPTPILHTGINMCMQLFLHSFLARANIVLARCVQGVSVDGIFVDEGEGYSDWSW